MRIIGLYSQLLLRKHKAEFSPQAEGYLATIVREAGRMTGIVSGLVSYSRLVSETDPIPLAPVMLGPLIEHVVDEIRPEMRARSAEIQVGPMPVVMAEAGAMISVFRHLLVNAITYVADGVPPRVRVTASHSESGWVVSVSDNGVGIAPQYHEKIWGVFKRLHGHDIPGTGIGLSVVRKVIQQHGGRVWVESSGGGAGSTFRFTLAAPQGLGSGTAPATAMAMRF
jgi:signal transduction histidine kinase